MPTVGCCALRGFSLCQNLIGPLSHPPPWGLQTNKSMQWRARARGGYGRRSGLWRVIRLILPVLESWKVHWPSATASFSSLSSSLLSNRLSLESLSWCWVASSCPTLLLLKSSLLIWGTWRGSSRKEYIYIYIYIYSDV